VSAWPRWLLWLMFHGTGGRQAEQIGVLCAAEIERLRSGQTD
jgi:hypothetical protein